MRILWITHALQHPMVRGSDRHYHFVKELSRRHEITLLTLARSEVPAEAMEEMATYTERTISSSAYGHSLSRPASLLGQLPRFGKRLEKGWRLREAVYRMRWRFARLLQQELFDVVLFHGKSVFPVIEDWNDLPLVVDFCDATSLRVRTEIQFAPKTLWPWLALRYIQVRQVEKKLVSMTPYLAFISARDREAVLGTGNRFEIIPNGVDLQYWSRRTHSPQANCLIFTGVMDYAPNEDAALFLIERILPLIRPRVSNLQVLLAGRDPTPRMCQLAARHPGVSVTGSVRDLRPYLERATLFVAPLRYAAGMQNKVLEAMAMELPVIAPPLVAAGLRIDGQAPPICVADGEKQLAERVIYLLEQEQERRRLAAAGRQFVADHFVWSRSAEKLEQLCVAAIGSNSQVHAERGITSTTHNHRRAPEGRGVR